MAIQTINVNSSIDMQRLLATVRPATVDLAARTIEVVFTTGQAGRRWHWDIGYFSEELEVTETAIRQERLQKGLSVIDSHDTYSVNSVFGITEAYRIENGELIGTVRFAKDEDSEAIFQKVADGILRHFSLGYIVHRYEASITPSDDSMDTYRAVDWEPTELSIVTVSFETQNGVRSMESPKPAPECLLPLQLTITGDDNTMKFRNFIPQHRRNGASEHGDQGGGAAPTTSPAPAAPAPVAETRTQAPAPAAPVAAPATEQRGLIAEFVTSARALGFDHDHAIAAFTRNISVDQYNRELVQEMAQRSVANTPGVQIKSDNNQDHKEQERSAIADSIMARAGIITYTPESRKFAGASLMDLARHIGGMSNQLGMSPLKAAERAFQSTSDFPLILENVMNKTLAAGYQETPRTFLDLGTRASVNDFREKHTYRMGDAPSLLPLGENGEYKAGTIGEAKESYAIDTFARKIGFSRKMLINDDLSALTMVPRMFGQAGSRLESDLVWGLLLNYDFRKGAAAAFKMRDGKHLFHADHKNLITTGSALSETSLSAIRKLGRDMKTIDGNFMNINWDTIVVPTGLETTAEKLLINTILATQTANTNSFQGKYGFRVEPRLNVVSETAWFAFSQMIKSFEYAYLAGDEGMYTEVNQSTDVDGLEILVRKDFGVGFADERGAAKATGAA